MKKLILIILLIFTLSNAQLVNETFKNFVFSVPADSIVSSYVFDSLYHADEVTGKNALKDLTGNISDWQPLGTFAWEDSLVGVSGVYENGYEVHFDGTSDYFNLADAKWAVSRPVIAIVVRSDDITSNQTIDHIGAGSVSADGGMRMYLSSSAGKPAWQLFFDAQVAVVSSTIGVNDGNIHVVVFSYDGANMKIFVDGVQAATTAKVGTPYYDSNYSHYVGFQGGGLQMYKGFMSAYTYMDAVFTAADIRKFYRLANNWYSKLGNVTRESYTIWNQGFYDGDSIYIAVADSNVTTGYTWQLSVDAKGTKSNDVLTAWLGGGTAVTQILTTVSTTYILDLGSVNTSGDSLWFSASSGDTVYIDNVVLSEALIPVATDEAKGFNGYSGKWKGYNK